MLMDKQNVLPAAGFARLHQIVGNPAGTGPVPVSRATWYAWIKQGHAPAPVKLGPRASAWRVEDVRAFVEKLGDGGE